MGCMGSKDKLIDSSVERSHEKSSNTGQRRKSISEQIMQAVMLEDLVGSLHAGDLWKKSDWKHEWRERHLVLYGDVIHNFKNGDDSTSDGLHLISSSKVREAPLEEGPTGLNRSLLCFEVTGSKTWMLAVPTVKERASWISSIQATIDNVKLKENLEHGGRGLLTRGEVFTKYHNDTFGNIRSKDRKRMVKADTSFDTIQWSKLSTPNEYDQIKVKLVKEAVRGKQTSAFRGTGSSVKAELCFSILSSERTLDLVAETEEMRDKWVDAINGLVKFGASEEETRGKQEKLESALKRENQLIQEKRHDKSRDKFQELLQKNKSSPPKKSTAKGKKR